MIKLVYIIHRLPSLPPPDFYTYWLSTHGPLVHKHASTLRIKRYIQSHTLDTPWNDALQLPRGMLPPIAGITEVWYDSLADLQAGLASPEGQAAAAELAADEARFIDIGASCVFLTEEHTIFDFTSGPEKKVGFGYGHGGGDGDDGKGEELVKATYLVRKRDDVSLEECQRTWLHDHGPLLRRTAAEQMGMAKYVQSHTVHQDVMEPMTKGRGFADALEGITEVWMNLEFAGEKGQSEEAKKAGEGLLRDEARFVDFAKSRCFVTREHVIF